MKPRLPLPLRFSRSYATRLPERPPYRAPDPLRDNPHAVYESLPENATFIHRPPPTAPSPLSYTTAPASPLLQSSPTPTPTPTPTSVEAGSLPPQVWKDKGAKPRVSDEDLAQIRRLRREDPATWTRTRLAQEFNCTPWFVGRVTSLKGPERRKAQEEMAREHEAARAKWGERRALNEDIRKRRKEFW
ncbi:mitochondrial ribosomal protein subunit L20-domain-containing protein [Daedaleopsis nitida]|nr:mitochondrial ribosomal protein subunit L20-domain-containing protein [Daedaleopsis nitida]